ncbi:MAG: DNA polymerase III subunit gamma/tau [Magnetococcales bacterium]|nr:DNA polymerase III subunit gamma/tau [Magnetococcales bacterium]
MTAYVVLARRWRPRNFASLIGQQHVVQALQNALIAGRMPHAILFSGTRGVGKTTLARILAMRLNCRETTTPEPCGQCPSCAEVISGSHPDVMEIDAASRTKVEQMRELLELAPYAPTSAPYKVFILDEVHMLSTQAFNALLKTLEEPPSHVKFIFATTEPRKIPATILSRCQRHDLKRVTAATLTSHLEAILTSEGIAWDDAGLQAVVTAADGSVRDGLSLLDQAIAHGNGTVRHETVHTLLGLTDQDAVTRLLEHLLAGQGPELLQALDQFHAGGVEPNALARDLLDQVHQRVRARVTRTGPVGPHSLEHLQMVYQTLLKGEGEIKFAQKPAQALEMMLLRAAYLRPIPELDKLIASLSTGGAPQPPPTPVRPVMAALPPPPPAPERVKPPATWEQLLSLAKEHDPEVHLRFLSQVACLAFDKDAGENPVRLHLQLLDDCFGTPEQFRAMLEPFLARHGMAGLRIKVDPPSGAPRPETTLEQNERQAREHRATLEQEVKAHPMVQRFMTEFDARLIGVEAMEQTS